MLKNLKKENSSAKNNFFGRIRLKSSLETRFSNWMHLNIT